MILPSYAKTVLITGGTGTFGRAAVASFLVSNPHVHLRVLSRSEHTMAYLMSQMNGPHAHRISFCLGDVRDQSRMRLACRGADVVIHAAALKHVDIGEYNPDEVVETNVNGTRQVIRACLDEKVRAAVLLSTDKAVYPINLYGATKMTAERLWVQANVYAPTNGTRFNVVRYGNVMNSRGSILEKCETWIKHDEPFILTHPDMTRFWVSIEQALWLVCYVLQHQIKFRGHVIIPHVPAFSVSEMLQVVAELSGITHPIQRGAVRPGEKLAEYLLTREEERCVSSFSMMSEYYEVPPLLEQCYAVKCPDAGNGVANLLSLPSPYESARWPYRLTGEQLRLALLPFFAS